MGLRHESEDRLRAILQQAYHARGADAVSEAESRELMRRIRGLAEPKSAASPGMVLDRLFWRLAPAAGALIAVMIAVAFNLDLVPEATVWTLWSYESEASEIAQIMLY